MGKKTRKGTPKSRNGCTMCKKRRKKCDETRPRCGGCEKLNYECIYTKQLYWNQTNQITYTGALLKVPATNFMLVSTVKDLKLNFFLNGCYSKIPKESYVEFKIPTKSIHEDDDFQNIINSEGDIKIENDLFEYYVAVISGKKVFSDGMLNEFRSIIIPNSIISPALFQSIIALSASDLNRSAISRDKYYSKLTAKYKNEAISSMYDLLDNPSSESINEIGICILMLCTLEIGENGNDNWINYLKQSCMIFQSVKDDCILDSKPLMFCYRYFTFRYILLLSTLNESEYDSMTSKFPMKLIPSFFESTDIDYMSGCSPQLIRIINDITYLKNRVDTKRIEDIHQELKSLEQHESELGNDKRLVECSKLYCLTTCLYFYNSFHHLTEVSFNGCKIIEESICSLDTIISDPSTTLFPTWPLFMISISDVHEIGDNRRIKILGMVQSIERTWPKSSLTIIKRAIELIWKNYDLNDGIDWRDVLNLIGFKVCLT